MSSYNKHERSTLLAPINSEKKVLEALVNAESRTHSTDAEAQLCGLKARLTASKKHSSATLLRRKLQSRLVRKLQEI